MMLGIIYIDLGLQIVSNLIHNPFGQISFKIRTPVAKYSPRNLANAFPSSVY